MQLRNFGEGTNLSESNPRRSGEEGEGEPIQFPKGRLTEEVLRKVREGVSPLPVVVEPNRDTPMEELIESLREGQGEVTGSTDRYIFFVADTATVRGLDENPQVFRVWLDKPVHQHAFGWLQTLQDSVKTIKVDAVWRSFGAMGEGIRWAVLDSGINSGHPGFGQDGAGLIDGQFDTTGEGIGPANFHGTHVAGILGQIAPKVTIDDYKVLGQQGGSTSTIVQALYDVRMRNEQAITRSHKIEVHGINMSLGGYHDVESYAVGWSPESREVARLVRQGCLVVVSAGNEGYQAFATIAGGNVQIFPNFVPASIGDPGVAEEAITVGSTHRRYPRRYGVSYFSSKGPTGDGRKKPDVLAPGEQIVSFDDRDGTTTATGTSMAAPHVSGVLALFLSQFPGYQGNAFEVKRLLLETCSDLGRDPNFQGRGLVDAFRLFQAT